VPWSRKGRAIPLFPYGPYGLYRALVPVQGCTLPYLSACTRVHFTSPFIDIIFLMFCWPRIVINPYNMNQQDELFTFNLFQ